MKTQKKSTKKGVLLNGHQRNEIRHIGSGNRDLDSFDAKTGDLVWDGSKNTLLILRGSTIEAYNSKIWEIKRRDRTTSCEFAGGYELLPQSIIVQTKEGGLFYVKVVRKDESGIYLMLKKLDKDELFVHRRRITSPQASDR